MYQPGIHIEPSFLVLLNDHMEIFCLPVPFNLTFIRVTRHSENSFLDKVMSVIKASCDQ